MVNEDIITSLRNSLARGESLTDAIQILKNSGYNANEVQEASNYVGGGVLPSHQIQPNEHLLMPSQKNMLGKPIQNPNLNQNKPNRRVQGNLQQMNSPQGMPPRFQQNPPQGMPPKFQQNSPQGMPPRFQKNPPQVASLKSVPQGSIPYNSLPGPATPSVEPQKKKSYFKEIFLLFILIILIGVLGLVIMFRDEIISMFG